MGLRGEIMKLNIKFVVNIVLIALIVIGIGNIVRMTAFAAKPVHTSGTEDAMLFVMSFCPYGVQAEQAMKPVVDMLGDSVSIAPHFIVNVANGEVQSLHGAVEAKEDMRQACIWKYYDQKTFWSYVDNVNGQCSLSNIETCWKTAASSASVDTTKIETCATDEGIALMTAEAALSEQYGVSGSPTLIIAGEQVNAARTPDGYKTAICNSLTDKPAGCSQTLNSTAAAATGGCS